MHTSFPAKATIALLIACALGLAVVVATKRGQAPPAGSSGAAADRPSVVAQVDGEPITAEELDRSLGAALDRLEQQVYDMRRRQLDALIADKLLAREAARRGTTVEALLAGDVKSAPVSDADVDQFFEANKGRLPQQPDIKVQIKRYLQTQRDGQQREAYVRTLRERAKVVVTLAPPPVTRVSVDTAGAPSKGPDSAPVTIVEFSDFHCPFCRRVKPTIAQVLERYAGKVRLVFMDLPLDSLHPTARDAAEAARCAHDQGRFWEYHDRLYERGADASPATLRAVATDAGLDLAAFDACTTSDRHVEAIQKSVDQAERLGLSGTPAFFINGRLLSGAQPFDAFVRVIDEELAGTAKTR